MAGTFGWWFARRPVKRGDVHAWDGTPVPGRAGLHAAKGPLAALPYATSDRLCRVSLHGEVAVAGDQMAATLRRVEQVVDAVPILSPRVHLGHALASGPPHVAAYTLDAARLRVDRDAYVIATDAAHVDALAVHLARTLESMPRLSVIVVPENGAASALHEGRAGVVSIEAWTEPPIDDHRVVDAVFEAMERPPLDLAYAADLRASLHELVPLLEGLSAVSAAGYLSAHVELASPVIAVWIADAFAEERVRAEVERCAPGAFVFVTGASRLTPGLEPHVITPNEAATRALPEASVVALSRALHQALAIDPFYRRGR